MNQSHLRPIQRHLAFVIEINPLPIRPPVRHARGHFSQHLARNAKPIVPHYYAGKSAHESRDYKQMRNPRAGPGKKCIPLY